MFTIVRIHVYIDYLNIHSLPHLKCKEAKPNETNQTPESSLLLATTHNKTKAFILLTLTVSLPSFIIIRSMSKSNPPPGTIYFRRMTHGPRDSVSITATTDTINNGSRFIATNTRPFPPKNKSQIVSTIANRTIKRRC